MTELLQKKSLNTLDRIRLRERAAFKRHLELSGEYHVLRPQHALKFILKGLSSSLRNVMESNNGSSDDVYMDFPPEDAPQNWHDDIDDEGHDREDRVINHHLSDVMEGIWGPTVTATNV
jgi:hypothetical protein